MVFDRGKIIKYSNICTSEVLELESPNGSDLSWPGAAWGTGNPRIWRLLGAGR